VFTSEFASVSPAEIAEQIKNTGFYLHPTALDPKFIDAMMAEFGPNRVAVNEHGIFPVCFGRTWYLNQVLARSKHCFDLVTSNKILDIGEQTLGHDFRLVTKRYYTTREGAKMAWHRDNKSAPHEVIKAHGLIFIFYMTDVTHGAFQFIRGSHDRDEATQIEFPDEYVARTYPADIVTYQAPRGAFIVYDIRTIHRAEPFAGIDYERSSLFMGMMAEPTKAEPVLINTSFFDKVDDRLIKYLGFGKKELARPFPATVVKDMDDQTTLKVKAEVDAWQDEINQMIEKARREHAAS